MTHRHSVNAGTAAVLLFGNAETGRKIAANKKSLMPVQEYIKMIDGINRTVKSEDL